MKKWVSRLVEQLDLNSSSSKSGNSPGPASPELSEDRATLAFVLDTLSKHLLDLDQEPIRTTREKIDSLSKGLLTARTNQELEPVLFEIRQFWGSYRLEEYSYVQKTFDDFRRIVLEFVAQLGEDLSVERKEDQVLKESLDNLKEAVEANSIETLKSQSRKFIDQYVQVQGRKQKRRDQRMVSVKNNLNSVKQQLGEAQETLKVDHLTKAFNRRTFDEMTQAAVSKKLSSDLPSCLILLDIDYFKRINDSYGHPVGDFVLQEFVALLKEEFKKDGIVSRIGGEEFAVLLEGLGLEQATRRAETALWRIRGVEFKREQLKLKFTASMGIAELNPAEIPEDWVQRADLALYQSKKSGRNRWTVASPVLLKPAG